MPQDKLHSLSFLQELNEIGFFGLPTLKQPTYSWPSERAGVSRLRSIILKLCPCDLLMVIAMLCLTGNCSLFDSTGSHLHFTPMGSGVARRDPAYVIPKVQLCIHTMY